MNYMKFGKGKSENEINEKWDNENGKENKKKW